MRSSLPPSRRTTGRFSALTALVILLVAWSGSPARAALSITAPATANLGSHAFGGGTLSVQLATTTVTSTDLIGAWTATVTSTNCTTGAGASYQTIPRASLTYWSGPATATTGLPSLVSPGQPTAASAVTLAASRTAFSATTMDLDTSTVSWEPTLSVAIPTNVIVGTYTCTITHSVA
ncbi:hypothetical protein [Frankia gtarii]|uniref:hypothetical protein n=1 Tax=Frankia gtarii TaxID=2950102 RepID=UPI0021BE8EC0|nr:hypothetical protein [Frankia gtarii]